MNLDSYYGLIGVALLVVGLAAIAVEGALAAVWSLRIARLARTLNERIASEQSRLESDLERLRLALAETQTLWQPYARLLRWLRHPITIALLQSFARRSRRAAAR